MGSICLVLDVGLDHRLDQDTEPESLLITWASALSRNLGGQPFICLGPISLGALCGSTGRTGPGMALFSLKTLCSDGLWIPPVAEHGGRVGGGCQRWRSSLFVEGG
jgi:hypothetical protein